MNEDKTFIGNQYIAKFMGWTLEDITIYVRARNGDMGKLAYNERWDLLMPVIEKIESLPTDKEKGEEYQFSITGDGIAITKFDDGSGIIAEKVNVIGETKLPQAFECVATFCREYLEEKNRQKAKQK